MVKTRKGSATTALLLLCTAGALVAGVHAGPPQSPAPQNVERANPAKQRIEMIALLKSIDGHLATQAETAGADGQQMVGLLKQINSELQTMDQRLKQIEVELSRANAAD